jgi:hypothetical protein
MRSRVVLVSVACILLAVCVGAKALASVFCDADVAALVRANAPKPENPRIPQPQFALMLDANAPGTLNGDVVLLTDDAAYDVNFSDLVAIKNATGTTATTKPLFVSFSKPLSVRYAWVDQIGMNGAAPHPCPTNPFIVGAPSDEAVGSLPVPAMIYAINAFQFVSATFKMNLPPTDCKEPYRKAEIVKFDKRYVPSVWDTSAGLKTSGQARVYLDSDGKFAGFEILKSSGSVALDDLGKYHALNAQYRPAVFRCVPVVGTVDFTFSYEIER